MSAAIVTIHATTAILAPLVRWRCPKCNTTLAMLRLMPGSVVEIKCYRCNTLVKECA